DGIPDFASADEAVNNLGSNVTVFESSSAGHYVKRKYPFGDEPRLIVAADINLDGKLDLVTENEFNGTVDLFLNSGNGVFRSPEVLHDGGITAASVAVGDLNGDGKPDIVAATSDASGNNGSVYIFYATPPASAIAPAFLAPRIFPAGAQPQAVRIADVNGDGLPDIVVANLDPGADGTGSAGVSVLLQDAAHPGSFLAPVTYATQGDAVDVAVADLNGDGKPDLVVANLEPAPTGSVSVLLQDPARPGVFLAATSYQGFGQPLAVAIADLNGDGHPDIAVADGTSATVMLQSATSPGTFAQPVQVGN
ncbi:MAG TPA: VCBS repeat-containing protein, partial [Candidatus Angelobacter sp.]|nr:VCBS repeat-containing protein [Candidatus Angelobacter sp.]